VFSAIATAQQPPAAHPKAQKGVVLSEEASVFKSPDFDGEVIGTAKAGDVFDMSIGKKGEFYKIRWKPGQTAWMSDAEIVPQKAAQEAGIVAATSVKQNGAEDVKPKKKRLSPEELERRRKPINQKRFVGLVLENVNYTESTMSALRHESLLFYGARWSGPNTLFSGEMSTEAEIMFHSGAPNYYKTVTGNAANGFAVFGNFLFITDAPQSRSTSVYYGFGPMFKFTQFTAQLSDTPVAGSQKSYAMTDMNLGAVFGAGIATLLGNEYAARLDGRYYWEGERYFAISLAIQKEF
jgi:hypothetical protein